MKKLVLKVDDLEVTSFEPVREEAKGGTVNGFYYPTGKNSCLPPDTCDQCVSYDVYGPTCDLSCQTCDASCPALPC